AEDILRVTLAVYNHVRTCVGERARLEEGLDARTHGRGLAGEEGPRRGAGAGSPEALDDRVDADPEVDHRADFGHQGAQRRIDEGAAAGGDDERAGAHPGLGEERAEGGGLAAAEVGL